MEVFYKMANPIGLARAAVAVGKTLANNSNNIKNAVAKTVTSTSNTNKKKKSSGGSSTSSTSNLSSGAKSVGQAANIAGVNNVYKANSELGKSVLSNMKTGDTYKASDGSTWTRFSDGSTLASKDGKTYWIDYDTDNYSTSTSNGITTRTNKSTGQKSYSGTVNYHNQDIDLGTDYQSQINQAIANGDYALASQLNDKRNAKINYLNDNNLDKSYSVSNDNYNYSPSELPSSWKTAIVNGNQYSNVDGRIYDKDGVLKGTGWNTDTGEFTVNNYNDAQNIAAQWLANNANAKQYGLTNADYYLQNGAISSEFLNAIMNGTVGSYSRDLAARIQEQKRLEMLAAQQLREQIESFNSQYEGTGYYMDDDGNVLYDDSLINNGSYVTEQEGYNSSPKNSNAYQNAYDQYIRNQLGLGRMNFLS